MVDIYLDIFVAYTKPCKPSFILDRSKDQLRWLWWNERNTAGKAFWDWRKKQSIHTLRCELWELETKEEHLKKKKDACDTVAGNIKKRIWSCKYLIEHLQAIKSSHFFSTLQQI